MTPPELPDFDELRKKNVEIKEHPIEYFVYHPHSEVGRFVRKIMQMIERQVDVPKSPPFRVHALGVEPMVSLDADQPDQVRIMVEIVGIWNPEAIDDKKKGKLRG